MRPRLRLFLAAAFVAGFAAPAAHAFSIQPIDSPSARASFTDPEERLTTPSNDGNGTTIHRFGNGTSSFSVGTTVQNGAMPGFPAAGLTPLAPGGNFPMVLGPGRR